MMASAGTASALLATRPRNAAGRTPTNFADVDPGAIGLKLLGRITFGPLPEDIALFNTLGYDAYLEYQLDHNAIADQYVQDRFAGLIAGFPALTTLTMTGEQMVATNSVTAASTDLVEATIIRAVYSKRQLYERMVEFWNDHFNIELSDNNQQLRALEDRDAIRANALGNFRTLLDAVVRSPAMLDYLNNDLNTASAPNENYARELMELHTMSVNGGYTQADVVAVARCLTGWTYYRSGTTPTNLRLTFRYRSTVHDNAAKVLSPTFNLTGTGPVNLPANQAAMKDGTDVLDILVRHPSTAAFIARKLCIRFIGEDCPATVINDVKSAYLNNGQGVLGDIKAMLRVMLRPNVVYAATSRLKRPFHLIASAIRATGTIVLTVSGIRNRLVRAGHAPFAWSPPDGYPDTNEYWSGQQLPRWNIGVELPPSTTTTGSNIVGLSVDVVALLAGANSSSGVVSKLNDALLQGEMSDADQSQLNAYLAFTTFNQQSRNETVGLALASPSFQWI